MEVEKMDEYISKQTFKDKYLCCGYLPEMSETEFDAFPAADVVEVRHGYWIDHHSGGSFCSACKRWVPYSHHPKYCETCGARMDKEDDLG